MLTTARLTPARLQLSKWGLHFCCGFLFSVSAAILAWTGISGKDPSALFFGTILFVVPIVALVRFWSGAWRPRLTLTDCLIGLISVVGVLPALRRPLDEWLLPIGFGVSVFIRSILLFSTLPRSKAALVLKFERIVLLWLFISIQLFTVGSIIVSRRNGLGLDNGLRFGQTGSAQIQYSWANPNNTGMYAAFLILVCFMSPFIPKWIRIPAGLSGLYILVLTQSRTTLLALIITLLVYGFLRLLRQPRKLAVWGIVLMMTVAGIGPAIGVLSKSFRPVEQIVQRTQRSDPTTGRVEIVRQALERFEESPILGLGYMAEGTRFENGFVSMATESGVIGVTLYLFFLGLVVSRAWPMLKWDEDPRGQELSRIVLTLTAFILLRSVGERSHGFQVSNVIANAWMILSGYLFAYRATLPSVQIPVAPRITAPALVRPRIPGT